MDRSTAEEIFPVIGDQFSESELNSPISAPSFSFLSQNDQPPCLQVLSSNLLQIISTATETEVEVLEKISMHERNMAGIVCGPNDRKKLMVKNLQMEGYHASLCSTSWVSSFGRSRSRFIDPSEVLQYTGKYEYIDVMVGDGNDDENPKRLIVDMDFRSEFVLARPTPSYMELANMIPSIFVGTEEKLKKIVSLMCSAMRRSLRESGLHIPPWRKTSYMQSKWLSKDCKKVSV